MEQINKLCPHCKKEIDLKASRCPHCHGKIFIWTKGRKILAGFAIFTVFILVITNVSSDKNNSQSIQENKPVIPSEDLSKWKETPAGKLCAKHTTWQKEDCDLIVKKSISIGMSKEQVILSIGKPEKINTTSFANSTNEQWVYGDDYIYFENGILTSVQQSK